MLLAFVWCPGSESNRAELCIVADKPDQFSYPLRVDTLVTTEAAVYRVGPSEAMTVRKDPKEAVLIIQPLVPAKLFLTPDLPQYPGVHVKKIKIAKMENGSYQTFFLQEKDQEGEWREWHPLRDKV